MTPDTHDLIARWSMVEYLSITIIFLCSSGAPPTGRLPRKAAANNPAAAPPPSPGLDTIWPRASDKENRYDVPEGSVSDDRTASSRMAGSPHHGGASGPAAPRFPKAPAQYPDDPEQDRLRQGFRVGVERSSFGRVVPTDLSAIERAGTESLGANDLRDILGSSRPVGEAGRLDTNAALAATIVPASLSDLARRAPAGSVPPAPRGASTTSRRGQGLLNGEAPWPISGVSADRASGCLSGESSTFRAQSSTEAAGTQGRACAANRRHRAGTCRAGRRNQPGQ